MSGQGGLKLKHCCFRCGVNKWIVDYKEGCAADISATSICLFCELAAKIQKQSDKIQKLEEREEKIKDVEKENLELKQRVVNLEALVLEIKNKHKEMNDDIAENGTGLCEVRKQLKSVKAGNVPEVDSSRESACAGKFTRATGRMITKGKSKVSTPPAVSTSNRYSLLSDTEEETILVGDSMVRDQAKYFGAANCKKRKIRTFPGANTKKILNDVNNLKVRSRKSAVIAQVSGNDLYLENGKVGQTEPIMKDLSKLVDSVAEKSDNGIIVGLLPRLRVSSYSLSKALGINDRLRSMCNQRNLMFVDFWDSYNGNRKYFKKDGVHFSDEGMRMFGNLLNLSLYNKIDNRRDQAVSLSVDRNNEVPQNIRSSHHQGNV